MPSQAYSICMTNYNTAPILGLVLRRLVEETHGEAEVIVVDAGSRDESPSILEGENLAGHIRYLRLPWMTRGQGRDVAWRASKGEYIIQLDSDRPLRPGAFRDLLETHARVEARYGRVALVAQDAMVCPRDLLDALGGYDRSLSYGEDRELWDRMVRREAAVYVDRGFTEVNWSVSLKRWPWRERLVHGFHIARDLSRLGMGLGDFLAQVRGEKGIAFTVLQMPVAIAGYAAGYARGRIRPIISIRTRTVEV